LAQGCVACSLLLSPPKFSFFQLSASMGYTYDNPLYPRGPMPACEGIAGLGPSEKGYESEEHVSAESAGTFHTATSGGGEAKPATRSTSPLTVPDCVSIDVRNTNLDLYHAEARFDQRITSGQFTMIKEVSDCCRQDGKVELYRWEQPWLENKNVIVKRVLASRVSVNAGKEKNERKTYLGLHQRHAEDVLNEIGIYCYLARQHDLPEYILRMHAVFQAGSDVWLVLEHADQGDLFTTVQKLKRDNNGSMPLQQVMLWTWQLLQAIRYLHGHYIGHRDISIENVLLCGGLVRLMDFGQSVRTHASNGELLRYFSALGKPYYRPPECHVPASKSVQVMAPPSARPGEINFAQTANREMCEVLLPSSATPGQPCNAEPWGYTVPPIDVFAAGVCLFIMATGMPPWREARLADAHFAWVHQQGVAKLLQAWKKPLPAELGELMASMMRSDPSQRPPIDDCLAHPWFKQMRGTAVPVHRMAEVAAPEPTSSMGAMPSMAAGFDYRDDVLADFAHSAAPSVSALEFFAESGAAADPYGRDPITRSVAAPDAGMPIIAQAPSCAVGDAGDFYRMQEEVCRFDELAPPHAMEEIPLERASHFSDTYAPPRAPEDKGFEFELTTLFMSSSAPVELSNDVLKFLKEEDGVTVKKVDQRAFTVRAESDSDAGTCNLKVSIYAQGGKKYAVEFQRRSGDSTALNDVYQKALDHFKERLLPERKESAGPTAEPAPKAAPDAEVTSARSEPAPVSAALAASQKSEQMAKFDASDLAVLAANLTQISPTRPAHPKTTAAAKGRPRQGNRSRRSVPAPASRMPESVLLQNLQHSPSPALALETGTTIVAGSGLNAVRWRSRSNAGGRRLSNSRLVSAGARAISTA